MRTVVVVGAGVTGLTVANALARRGLAVTVVERGPVAGGLARSFRYGGHTFDVGPHRFHTEDPDVRDVVDDVLGAEAITIGRASGVRAFGRTHRWPLSPRVLVDVPLGVMARAALDVLRRERPRGDSFEAEIVGRYGRTLYEAFFRRYTERFLGIAPAAVHRDWARAGVDRAVIDRRVRADGLLDLALGALLPRARDAAFVYPRLGVGQFAARLAGAFVATGGRLVLGAPVEAIETAGELVTGLRAGGERLPADGVVWTAPLTTALRLLGLPERGLGFLSTVLWNVELRAPSRLGYQWVYTGEEPAFVRVSDPAVFSPELVPDGRGALCVERTCREGDETWHGAERGTGAVLDALVRNGFVSSAADVSAVHVERVPDSYPVYGLDYPQALAQARASLAAYGNLLPAGRCGTFWYSNMDHAIAQALRVADGIERAASDGTPLAGIDVGERVFWA